MATKESDLDLIIDTKEQLRGFALMKLICEIEEKLRKDVDGFEKNDRIYR